MTRMQLTHCPADYASGYRARREGHVRLTPRGAPSDAAREWLAGYDAMQSQIDASAQWARDHAATVDRWGFV